MCSVQRGKAQRQDIDENGARELVRSAEKLRSLEQPATRRIALFDREMFDCNAKMFHVVFESAWRHSQAHSLSIVQLAFWPSKKIEAFFC